MLTINLALSPGCLLALPIHHLLGRRRDADPACSSAWGAALGLWCWGHEGEDDVTCVYLLAITKVCAMKCKQDCFEVRKPKKKICCLHAFSSSHTRKRRPLGVADLAHYLLLQKALVLPLQLFLQASHRSLCWSHGSFIFCKISGGMRAGALSETHLSFMMVAEALLSLLISFIFLWQKRQTNRKPDQSLMLISKCEI